jgi:hypothetical protein
MGRPTEKSSSKADEAPTTDLKKVDKKEDLDDLVSSLQLGVWQVLTVKGVPFDPKRWREEFVAGFSHFLRLVSEMYRLSPGMLVLFMLSKMWGGVEAAVLMHLSSRLLRIVRHTATVS